MTVCAILVDDEIQMFVDETHAHSHIKAKRCRSSLVFFGFFAIA